MYYEKIVKHGHAINCANDDYVSFEDMEEIVSELVTAACDKLGYLSEPSTQMGIGSDFILDCDNDEVVAVLDYGTEVNDVYDMYIENDEDFDKTVEDVMDYIERA